MPRKILIIAAALICLGLVAVWGSQLDWGIVARGDNDFAMLYTGAKLVGSASLYDRTAFQKAQREFANVHGEHVLYARLPYYALFWKPLALLPYGAAYLLFTLLNLAALLAFLYLFAPRAPADWRTAYWLCGVLSVPVLTAFVVGQDVALLLLIVGTAVVLIRRDSRFLAGVLLSLCTIKPHMFLVLPVLFLMRKEWRILLGGAAGGAGLFLVSAIAQGWNWPAAYMRLVSESVDSVPYTLPNLRGLVKATAGESLTMELVLAAAVIGLVALLARKIVDFETAVAAAIVGGLLVSHHAYIQDCCLLLAVAALARGNRTLRNGALLLLTPPFYFLLGAGTLSIFLPAGLVVLLASTIVSLMM
ncbi:MAG: glycosyltransferase family 87 protein [Bryobacteraceae bacterium]